MRQTIPRARSLFLAEMATKWLPRKGKGDLRLDLSLALRTYSIRENRMAGLEVCEVRQGATGLRCKSTGSARRYRCVAGPHCGKGIRHEAPGTGRPPLDHGPWRSTATFSHSGSGFPSRRREGIGAQRCPEARAGNDTPLVDAQDRFQDKRQRQDDNQVAHNPGLKRNPGNAGNKAQ